MGCRRKYHRFIFIQLAQWAARSGAATCQHDQWPPPSHSCGRLVGISDQNICPDWDLEIMFNVWVEGRGETPPGHHLNPFSLISRQKKVLRETFPFFPWYFAYFGGFLCFKGSRERRKRKSRCRFIGTWFFTGRSVALYNMFFNPTSQSLFTGIFGLSQSSNISFVQFNPHHLRHFGSAQVSQVNIYHSWSLFWNKLFSPTTQNRAKLT